MMSERDIPDTPDDGTMPDPALNEVWARVHGQMPYQLGHLIHSVSRKRKELLDRLLKPFDLTRSQLWVLANLARSDDARFISQIELANLLQIKKATLGGLVLRMERSGLIRRSDSKSDRRVRYVHLTAKGRKALIDIQDVGIHVNTTILNGISRTEEAALIKCLEIMERNIDNMDAGLR